MMNGYTEDVLQATKRQRVRPLRDGYDKYDPLIRTQTTDSRDEGPVVSVADLRKTYGGGVEALKDITFGVGEGEIVGMLGPNGAGKSTTLGILTTTVRPSGGTAIVAGHDVVRNPLAVRRSIGVVFQESVLDSDFSGLDNLRLHARLWRIPPDEAKRRIPELLDAMELASRASDGVRTYSGGMRRRLEIARALLSNPRVLFLDEPTLGLDPAVRQGIWDAIEELRGRYGVTVVLSTHYLEEAERVCDRVAIIHEGRIVALDAPQTLLTSVGEEAVEVKVDDDVAAVVQVLDGWRVNGSSPLVLGKTITIPLRDGTVRAAELMDGIRASGIRVAAMGVRRTTLNDVFMRLTGAGIDGQNGS